MKSQCLHIILATSVLQDTGTEGILNTEDRMKGSWMKDIFNTTDPLDPSTLKRICLTQIKPGCLLPRASPRTCSWIAGWKAEWRSRRASVFLRSRRHGFLLHTRHAPCSLWHQTKPLSPGINSYDSHLAVYCCATAFRSLLSIRASQHSTALALVTLKTSKHL